MKKVFIDGSAGTTGLRIYERLEAREDIELIRLPEALRKSAPARAEALNSCDAAFLCLPDEAARESAALVKNPAVRVIDTSTAHRTAPGWAYGFPELSPAHMEALRSSRRIASPGCHASGFVALVYPLVEAGIIPPSARLSCHSLTGYSGGGKKMIADYEAADRPETLASPRQYGLSQSHKHLPEMRLITGLESAPIFCPIVADYYCGMEVTVPLFAADLAPVRTAEDVKAVYRHKYRGPVVKYRESADEGGFLAANALSGLDSMEISVAGNGERLLLIARFDNLGKGASGAAIECMNIALGDEMTKGLELKND